MEGGLSIASRPLRLDSHTLSESQWCVIPVVVPGNIKKQQQQTHTQCQECEGDAPWAGNACSLDQTLQGSCVRGVHSFIHSFHVRLHGSRGRGCLELQERKERDVCSYVSAPKRGQVITTPGESTQWWHRLRVCVCECLCQRGRFTGISENPLADLRATEQTCDLHPFCPFPGGKKGGVSHRNPLPKRAPGPVMGPAGDPGLGRWASTTPPERLDPGACLSSSGQSLSGGGGGGPLLLCPTSPHHTVSTLDHRGSPGQAGGHVPRAGPPPDTGKSRVGGPE